jgi:formylglycine-generating enzyme required for sulfatase activity
VRSLAVAANGEFIASGGYDSKVRLWKPDGSPYSLASEATAGNGPPPAVAPFNAAQAKAHQETWAKHLGVPVEYTNSVGMKFRLIPPGEFQRGSTQAEIDAAMKTLGQNPNWPKFVKSEGPPHKVMLTEPYYVGVVEVTQKEYQAVMGANPSHFAATGPGKNDVAGSDTGTFPVETVNWDDAVAFCSKLSQQEGLQPFTIPANVTTLTADGTGYRLATEAEWEFAARGGVATKFSNGDQESGLASVGWYGPNAQDHPHAAGQLAGNAFGLFDMHGNLWEWLLDEWQATAYQSFSKQPAQNPLVIGNGTAPRAVRGGAWRSPISTLCRLSYRDAEEASSRSNITGFRVVLPAKVVKAAVGAQ